MQLEDLTCENDRLRVAHATALEAKGCEVARQTERARSLEEQLKTAVAATAANTATIVSEMPFPQQPAFSLPPVPVHPRASLGRLGASYHRRRPKESANRLPGKNCPVLTGDAAGAPGGASKAFDGTGHGGRMSAQR